MWVGAIDASWSEWPRGNREIPFDSNDLAPGKCQNRKEFVARGIDPWAIWRRTSLSVTSTGRGLERLPDRATTDTGPGGRLRHSMPHRTRVGAPRYVARGTEPWPCGCGRHCRSPAPERGMERLTYRAIPEPGAGDRIRSTVPHCTRVGAPRYDDRLRRSFNSSSRCFIVSSAPRSTGS